MANESRSRQSRQPATPQNSAVMGVVLVVAAVVIALLLFNAGGGSSKAEEPDRTAAESANGDSTTTVASTAPPTLTPPGNLMLVVGNGSGVKGRAKATTDKLATFGYTNNKAVDGNSTPNTIVYFQPGLDADALALATLIGLPPDRVQPLGEPSPLITPEPTANLVLLVGPDFDPATAPFTTTTAATN